MSIGIQIDAKNSAGPAARRVMAVLKPSALNPVIGRSATNTVRQHLFGLNSSRPNKLGGQRTNFYTGAARATNFRVLNDETVVVSVNQVGMAQRFYGGVIKPKTSKYLTIPASPLAYGKRAREFAGLVVLYSIHTKQPYALALGATSFQEGRKGVKNVSKRAGEIMFWLKKSVTQKPDPTVLPYDELIASRVQRDVQAVVERAIQREGGAKP